MKIPTSKNFNSDPWKRYVLDLRDKSRGVYDRILKSQAPEFYEFLLRDFSQFKLFGEKVYQFINGKPGHPKCDCGKEIFLFRTFKYADHCSRLCAKNDPLIKQREKENSILKYGVDHPMKSSKIRNNYKSAMIKKYGTDNPFGSIEIVKKIHQTKIKNGSNILHTDEYLNYKLRVRNITRNQNIKSLVNYSRRGRTKNDYHLDHRYSVLRGYLDNVEPKIIGSIINLEYIPVSLNCSKQEKCSITKEKLMELYNNSNPE